LKIAQNNKIKNCKKIKTKNKTSAKLYSCLEASPVLTASPKNKGNCCIALALLYLKYATKRKPNLFLTLLFKHAEKILRGDLRGSLLKYPKCDFKYFLLK